MSSERHEMSSPAMRVEGLVAGFQSKSGASVRAVDGVSLTLERGESLGIVGESGSGKSTLANSIVGLLPQPAGKIFEGEIWIGDKNIVGLSEREMRAIRRHEISLVMQDPHTALNPVFTIGDQVVEATRLQGAPSRKAAADEALSLLKQVNISAPQRRMREFPHQLSGGMKQRVVGAIALASHPRVLIADEPTTALDTTIQLQYLMLLKRIQQEYDLSIMFITHDLGVVAYMCTRVAVMYAGRIVEMGPVRDIFDQPSHPYTESLIGSLPKIEEKVDRLRSIEGQPPPLDNLPQGCRFAARCSYARELCEEKSPDLIELKDGHAAACWRHSPLWNR